MQAKLILSAVMMCASLPVLGQEDITPPQPDSSSPAQPTELGLVPSDTSPTETESATAEPTEQASGRHNRMVEEIIVTAQKREERLADVPISLQALSADALDARGITNHEGLSNSVPSLNITDTTGYAMIYLRGIGTDAWISADPSIATYIDGVYYSFTPSILQDFHSVERVEVLKGPQGTLFGRNAVGGAIVIHTKNPDFDQEETSVSFGTGGYSTTGYGLEHQQRTSVYTNLPISDTFAVNFSAYYGVQDPFLEGTTAGTPLNREINRGVKAKARWKPTDDLDLLFAVTRTESKNNGSAPINTAPSLLARTLLVPASEKGWNVASDEKMFRDAGGTVFETELRYNWDYLDFVLLASQQKHRSQWNFDFDSSQRPYVSFTIPNHPGEIRQADFQIHSNEGTWGSDVFNFITGAFIYDNPINGFDPIDVTVANIDPRNLAAQGINLPPALADQLNTVFGPDGVLTGALGELLPVGTPAYTLTNYSTLKTLSWSWYFQGTGKVTDWFSITAGLRYQDEFRKVRESSTRISLLDRTETTLLTWNNARNGEGQIIPNEKTTAGFTPKISLEFMPSEDNDTRIWLTYQEAIKAHVFNAYAIYLPPSYVKPEKLKAWELGSRTKIFQGAGNFSAALFYYDTKDLQTQFVSLTAGGAVTYENADKVVSKGIDFDLTTQIFPSVLDGWALSLNGAYLNAKYDKYVGSAFNPQTTLFNANYDMSGNRVIRSPEFSGSVLLNKSISLPFGYMEVGANYAYNSGFYLTPVNDPTRKQDAFGLLGAHMVVAYEPSDLTFKLSGTNLTNKFTMGGLVDTDFGPNLYPGPPRAVRFDVTWKF